ncbi:MAG: sigma-70 family RNA polymerase sigma factor, partial [Ignavibacteriaceae bacterium]
EEVTFTLQTLNKELSIDTPLDPNEEDSDALIDTIPDLNEGSPDKSLFKESMKADIENMLDILDERERLIVKMSLGIDRMRPATLEEIGDHFHLTRERIRQIKERALRKLRHSEKKKMLVEYLN